MILKLRHREKFLFLLVCSLSCSSYGDIGCPASYKSIAGKCFRFHQTQKSWYDAKAACANENAVLASLQTTDDYNGVFHYLNSNNLGYYWWSSGTLVNRQWVWSTNGSPMNLAWFGRRGGRAPPTSGTRCSYLCSYTNKYWDSNCTVRKQYICEAVLQPQAEVEISGKQRRRHTE